MSMEQTVKSESFYFGPNGGELFGWLHRPSEVSNAPSNMAVVFCTSFGMEDLVLHRALRYLADRCATQGVPALRFDLAGTGDSAGQADHSNQVDLWVQSVNSAVQEARALTGASKILLVGARLGATLAALAGPTCDGVCALIAIAPIVKGRLFLRELQMLGTATEGAAAATDGQGEPVLESAGFVLNKATQAALSSIDLANLQQAPAPDVLILDRDDIPPTMAWAKALTSLGAAVEQRPVTGYAQMMVQADQTRLPEQFADAVCAKLLALCQAPDVASAGHSSPGAASTRSSLMTPQFKEQAITLPGNGAFGILSEPSRQDPSTRKSAVLLLNAGCIRRVGPSRLYVELARQWAAEGHTVLRLDVAGLGDANLAVPGQSNDPYAAHIEADVSAALHLLRSKVDGGPCVAMGICSGAYHALKAAVRGEPLSAAIIINPLTFFWKEGMSLDLDPTHVQRSLNESRRWLKLLRGEVSLVYALSVMAGRLGVVFTQFGREIARAMGARLTDDLAYELRRASHHTAALQFIFSTTDPGEGMLRGQAGRTVDRLSKSRQLQIDRLDRADHIFTSQDARNRLIHVLDRIVLGTQPAARGVRP
jgi:alpha-beta hydrolase superfamily lysophospholipase